MIEGPIGLISESETNKALNAGRRGWLAHQYSVSVAKKIRMPKFDTILRELNTRLVDKSELTEKPGAIPGEYRTIKVFLPDAIFFPPFPNELPKIIPLFTSALDASVSAMDTKKVTGVNIEQVLKNMSFAHYWISRIHMFREGNGRTAREVNDLFSLRFGVPSIVLGPIDRDEYLSSLREIDVSASINKFDADLEPLTLFLATKMLRNFPQNISNYQRIQKEKLIHYIGTLKIQVREQRERWTK